jgi:hypothetical protein
MRHGKGCSPLKQPSEPCKKNRPKDISSRKSEYLHDSILELVFLFVNEAFGRVISFTRKNLKNHP